MPSNARYLLLLAMLSAPPAVSATVVQRCEAANGHITFTTLSCTAGESASLQDVRPSPSSSNKALLPEAEARETPSMKINNREPVVIGQTEENCANLISPQERRKAIINQRIVAGMSRQDVESALGKPDRISARNSTTSYRYGAKPGRSAQVEVEFDEKGCSTGKAKSRTAKSPQ
jgi:hypothetical protein